MMTDDAKPETGKQTVNIGVCLTVAESPNPPDDKSIRTTCDGCQTPVWTWPIDVLPPGTKLLCQACAEPLARGAENVTFHPLADQDPDHIERFGKAMLGTAGRKGHHDRGDCGCDDCKKVVPICEEIDKALDAYAKANNTESMHVFLALVRVLAFAIIEKTHPTQAGTTALALISELTLRVAAMERERMDGIANKIKDSLMKSALEKMPTPPANKLN